MAYTVKSGDTLGKIAAANGTTVSAIMALNPIIKNADLIQIGWTLALPGDSGSSSGGSGTPTDPAWQAAADLFEQLYGMPPRADRTLASIQRDIDAKQMSEGNITGVDPIEVNGTTVPQGATVVAVTNPTGSDAYRTYYLVYTWKGVELAYEVGSDQDFVDMFGPLATFTAASNVSYVSQTTFNNAGYVLAGQVDEIVGSTESLGSQIEREVAALGLEDLPSWLSGSSQALLLVAEATADGWSSGRLWQELSNTAAFDTRYGNVIDLYTQNGAVTIGDAVKLIEADEAALGAAVQPFLADGQFGTAGAYTDFLQGLIVQGWKAPIAAQVLEQADIFRNDPEAFIQANAILEASDLPGLNQIEFLNALNGHGPAEIVEALNTAAAGHALVEAGLDDLDLDLLMEVVDTSDRLLTVDSFQSLAQQLSFNMILHAHELDMEKLGVTKDDLIASAFGEESPSGKSSGEVLNLLARFQRDRQAAGDGFDATSAFQDQRGRLRVQGLSGL